MESIRENLKSTLDIILKHNTVEGFLFLTVILEFLNLSLVIILEALSKTKIYSFCTSNDMF